MKKQSQLGMNPSTASGRLVKDILFNFVKDIPCYRCGGILTRDTFSIEHKVAWLDSNDPVGLFFDLDNISYSHHSCNVRAGGKQRQAPQVVAEMRRGYWKKYRDKQSIEEKRIKRRNQYLRTGK